VTSTFYLVRHAETNWTLVNDRQLVGAANDLAPLTEVGVHQVEALTERLRAQSLRFILTSPMTRAMHTAALLSEWDRNSYADRARASRNGTVPPIGHKTQPARLPYTDGER
jgi:broad specificity phosphatase PhoE